VQATARPFALLEIPKGAAGIDTTLRIMRDVTRAQAALPVVRDAAIAITQGTGPYNGAERARLILEWVRSHVGFIPDPVQVEALTVPSAHLRAIRVHGQTSGDCDDGAVLIATLARSVGLQTRFVAASFLPSRRLHHVWAEAFDRDWIALDPFRAETFGGAETFRKVVNV
jgi:transglutaminase-like putative cysteine protease